MVAVVLARAAATFGVVGDIPAAAFESQGGSGDKTVDFAATFFVDGQRFSTELFDQFEPVTTVVALIFVKRHNSLATVSVVRAATGSFG